MNKLSDDALWEVAGELDMEGVVIEGDLVQCEYCGRLIDAIRDMDKI